MRLNIVQEKVIWTWSLYYPAFRSKLWKWVNVSLTALRAEEMKFPLKSVQPKLCRQIAPVKVVWKTLTLSWPWIRNCVHEKIISFRFTRGRAVSCVPGSFRMQKWRVFFFLFLPFWPQMNEQIFKRGWGGVKKRNLCTRWSCNVCFIASRYEF